MLTLLHMKLSDHPRFGLAETARKSKPKNEAKDSKEPESSATQPLDAVHLNQALYELKNCRLPEYSDSLQKLLNRRVVPGECALGDLCESLGKSYDKHGKYRGSRACDHSYPTELHVDLLRCPCKDCGACGCILSTCRSFCLTENEPNLEEKLFLPLASLYTSKYLIHGVRVFVKRCLRCKVTYLPYVVDREGTR